MHTQTDGRRRGGWADEPKRAGSMVRADGAEQRQSRGRAYVIVIEVAEEFDLTQNTFRVD